MTSTAHWCEIDELARKDEMPNLARSNRKLAVPAEGVGSLSRIVLNIDSSNSPVDEEQEKSANNNYFESVYSHPWHMVLRKDKVETGNSGLSECWRSPSEMMSGLMLSNRALK